MSTTLATRPAPRTTTSRSTELRSAVRPPCVDARSIFHHPLLEDPPNAKGHGHDRVFFERIRDEAASVCRGCPLLAQCLYTAVVDHDVAGYVAGTLPEERRKIRRRLAVTIVPENLDDLARPAGGPPVARAGSRRTGTAARPTRSQVLDTLIGLRTR